MMNQEITPNLFRGNLGTIWIKFNQKKNKLILGLTILAHHVYLEMFMIGANKNQKNRDYYNRNSQVSNYCEEYGYVWDY